MRIDSCARVWFFKTLQDTVEMVGMFGILNHMLRTRVNAYCTIASFILYSLRSALYFKNNFPPQRVEDLVLTSSQRWIDFKTTIKYAFFLLVKSILLLNSKKTHVVRFSLYSC